MGRRDDFVEVQKIEGGILVDLKYATLDNFTGRAVYNSSKCYLRRGVAEKLARVQRRLTEKKYGLKVWDGYRPLSVQKIFWDLFPDERFIANPYKGLGKHPRGAAVDLTLVTSEGAEVAMPTPFDSFTAAAHRSYTDLPEEVIYHRSLLEQVMQEEGFLPLLKEWWHYDDAEWSSYSVVDIPIEDLV